MKKYIGFLIVLSLFVLGGLKVQAAVNPNTPCAASSTPSITVLSPNGGEIYTVGDEMKITWKTCNFGSSSEIVKIGFDLITVDNDGGAANTFLMTQNGLLNDGSESVIIPSNVPTASNYKIRMYSYDPDNTVSGGGPYYKVDKSDNSFTITQFDNANDFPPGCSSNSGYSATTGLSCASDKNLISYWYGKVNQHVESSINGTNNAWRTDPDGVSGADIDMLSYCKKWYPNTTSVQPYKKQTLVDWHDRGNLNNYTSTRMAYTCAQGQLDQKPSITVLSPNGGETFILGKQINVTWNTKQFSNNAHVGIDLTQKIGDVYAAIRALAQTTNDGNEVVTIPTDVKLGDNYLITVGIIEIGVSPHILDRSDSTFTINSFSTSTKFPDGCNSAMGFSSTTGLPCFLDTNPATSITKNSAVLNGRLIANAPAEMYFMYNKTGNGIKVERTEKIAQQNNGSFSYTLSNLSPNTSYDFKACMYYVGAERCARQLTFKTFPASVIQEEDGCKNSEIYSSTTGQKCPTPVIELEQKPLITVLSPNGGETFVAGQQINVKWTSKNIPNTDNMVIYITNGIVNSPALTTKNDGQEIYTIPANFSPNSDYILFVTTYSGIVNYAVDNSDNFFTITKSTNNSVIQLNSPNGGETYIAGQQVLVKWETKNIPGNIAEINLTPVHGWGGGEGVTFDKDLKNDGQEMVTLPGASSFIINNVPFGKYFKIEIVAADKDGIMTSDYSDDTFTINKTTDIPTVCKANELYSSTTGQKCPTPVIELEQKCDSATGCPQKETPVIIKQACNSPAGCFSTSSLLSRVLKVGVKGEDVKYIQTLLGITADGSYGPMTAQKVKEWQAKNMLKADGIFGTQSMSIISQ